jgi:uncharacterized membrane protein YccC
MKLRQTTKMAYQAAIAIAIAELVSMSFDVERGYWIVATAMVLTTQTWGESVKRALERVGMTVFGGAIGTLLYFLLPNHDTIPMIALMLFCLFFATYMAKIYYFIAMFFMTCFVVFLFALIGGWDLMILRARIIDTALGALIALVVSGLFFSLKTDMAELFVGYLQKINALLTTTCSVNNQPNTLNTAHLLQADFQKIKQNALAIRYELLFHRLNSRDFNSLLVEVEFCTQFVVNLIEAYHWLGPHLTQEERGLIAVAVTTTQQNIDNIVIRLQQNQKAEMLSVTNLTHFLTKEITEDPSRFATLESDALGFFNLIYFFTRLNTHLNNVYNIIDNAY